MSTFKYQFQSIRVLLHRFCRNSTDSHELNQSRFHEKDSNLRCQTCNLVGDCLSFLIYHIDFLLRIIPVFGILKMRSGSPNLTINKSNNIPNILIEGMNRKRLIFAIFLSLFLTLSSAQLAIDYGSSSATFHSNQGLIIQFRCAGSVGAYQFYFNDLPLGWQIQGNQLIIPASLVSSLNKWRLSVEAVDTSGRYVQQTVLISFVGNYISFQPVTLPTTGQRTYSSSSSPSVQQVNGASSSGGINDLVGKYPGINSSQQPVQSSVTNGFNINSGSGSSFASMFIADSQATYNPARDSYKPTAFDIKKDAVLRRQSNANKAVANLISIIQGLTANSNSAKQELILNERTSSQIKKAVTACDDELFTLQDTRVKIKNALQDRNIKLTQNNNQIKKNEQQLAKLQSSLQALLSSKKQSEIKSLPNSQSLKRLQISLESCSQDLNTQKQKIASSKITINANLRQIDLIKIEINESKDNLKNLMLSLTTIRTKITSLQAQLEQAKNEQTLILADQIKYEAVPIDGNNRIQALQIANKDLSAQIQTITNNTPNCSQYSQRIEAIQSIINKDTTSYKNILAEIQNQQGQIQILQSAIVGLKNASTYIPMEIKTLSEELTKHDTDIKRTNYLCQDRRDEQLKNQQLVQALTKKYQTSSENLKVANLNLEKARAEQQLANVAVNELLLVVANTTPFPQSGPYDQNPSLGFASGSITPNAGIQSQGSIQAFNPVVAGQNSINIQQVPGNLNPGSNSFANSQIIAPQQTTQALHPNNNLAVFPTNVPFPEVLNNFSPSTPSNIQVPNTNPIIQSGANGGSFTINSYLNNNQIIASPTAITTTTANPSSQSSTAPASFTIGDFFNQQNLQRGNSNTNSVNLSSPVASQTTTVIDSKASTAFSTIVYSGLLPTGFELASKDIPSPLNVGDARNYLLSNYQIDIGIRDFGKQLYPIDESSKKKLIVNQAANSIGLSDFACQINSSAQTAITASIIRSEPGIILTKDKVGNSYQLNLSLCTKIVSTSPTSSLEIGADIAFVGQRVLSLAGSSLYNAYMVVSTPTVS